MKTHRNVSHRQEARAERHLYEAVAQLRTPEECRAFFRDLCTPAELQAMADRWAVVQWLRRGLSYREVHRATGVSITTIGRVARFLANGNGGYLLAAGRLAPRHRPDSPEGGRVSSARQGDGARPHRASRNGAGERAARRIEGARHA